MFGSDSFPLGPNGQFPRQRVSNAGNELVPPQNMEEVYWRSGVARLPVVEKEYHGSVSRVKNGMSVGRPNIHASIHKGFRPRYAGKVFIGMPVMRQNVLSGDGLGIITAAEKEAQRQALILWQFEQKKARQAQIRLIAQQKEAEREARLRFNQEQELLKQKAKAEREFAAKQQMPDVKYRQLLAKQEQVRVLQAERHDFQLRKQQAPLDVKLAKAQMENDLGMRKQERLEKVAMEPFAIQRIQLTPPFYDPTMVTGMTSLGPQSPSIQPQQQLTSPYNDPYAIPSGGQYYEDTRPYVPGMPQQTMDEMYGGGSYIENRGPGGPVMADEYYGALGPEAELTPEADYQPENAWALW